MHNIDIKIRIKGYAKQRTGYAAFGPSSPDLLRL